MGAVRRAVPLAVILTPAGLTVLRSAPETRRCEGDYCVPAFPAAGERQPNRTVSPPADHSPTDSWMFPGWSPSGGTSRTRNTAFGIQAGVAQQRLIRA